MTNLDEIFYGTSGPRDADIVIIGESWGAEEKRRRRPFVGRTGDELKKILAECGIAYNKIFYTNVISEKPSDNKMYWFFHETEIARKDGSPFIKGLYPKDNIIQGVDLLRQQLAIVKPKLVIGFGNYALWALTDDCFKIGDDHKRKVPTGITSWRGSQLYCSEEMGSFKLLPTFHPAAIFNTWPWRYDIVHDLKARVRKALNDQWDPPPYNFTIQPSFEEVITTLEVLDRLAQDGPIWVAEDIETVGEFITCMGFAWSKLDAICIPFTRRGLQEHYWSEEEEIEIVLAIRKLHENPNIKVVGMNFLYDAQYLALCMCYITSCAADVMMLHHLCWPAKGKSLNYISSLYNFFHCYWKDEGKVWHPTFSDEQHWTYNCKDCVITYEANIHLQHIIDVMRLREQCDDYMEQFPAALEMMINGVLVDQEARKQLSKDLGALLDERRKWLENIIPPDVFPRKKKASPWYTSPKQQAELFYDILCLDEVKGKGKRSAKGRTVNDDALMVIGNREPILRPIVEAIQEIRSIGKFKTNFVEAELDPDGRLRCFFDPTGTRTFRWNSSKNAFGRGANLQTIPKGTED